MTVVFGALRRLACAAPAGAVLFVLVAGPVAAQERDRAIRFETGAQDAGNQASSQAGQDSAILSFFKSTELSGFVDIYYGYNFNRPRTVLTQLRNFDVQHNSFSMNLAEIALNKVPTADSRGGFRVDLDYGPTAATVHAVEPGTNGVFQNIGQAYLSYLAPSGKGLQFDIGAFVTPHGTEVIKTKDNWNYSRSLLFALAIPYYHMGARVTYPFSDRFTLSGTVVNGWNNVVDNNTGKTVGIQAIVTPVSAVTIVQNYMGGPEQNDDNEDWRHLSDTTVTYKANSRLALAANYDYGTDRAAGARVVWQGIAGYARCQANAWLALASRFEYYDDRDGFTTGRAQTVREVTLTGEVKHRDGVMMRVEYRRDVADTPVFLKNATERVKNQDTFTLGFVYAFSTKSP
jgi:hypothetical protein